MDCSITKRLLIFLTKLTFHKPSMISDIILMIFSRESLLQLCRLAYAGIAITVLLGNTDFTWLNKSFASSTLKSSKLKRKTIASVGCGLSNSTCDRKSSSFFFIKPAFRISHLAPNPRPFQIGTHPYSSLPVFWHAVFWHKQQILHAIMMEFIVLIADLCSHLSYSDFCRQFPSAWNLQFLKPHCGRSILIVHPPVCMLTAT